MSSAVVCCAMYNYTMQHISLLHAIMSVESIVYIFFVVIPDMTASRCSSTFVHSTCAFYIDVCRETWIALFIVFLSSVVVIRIIIMWLDGNATLQCVWSNDYCQLLTICVLFVIDICIFYILSQ